MRRWISLFGSLMVPLPALALPFTFQLIAGESTPVPGGTGTFIQLAYASVDEGVVVFSAFGTGGQSGIYSSSSAGGSVQVVADESTAIPGGGGGQFTSFGLGVPDGGTVVFDAYGSSARGIYRTATGGGYTTVADNATAIPGGPGTFTSFSYLAVEGEQVAFVGGGTAAWHGVYLAGPGGIGVVADKNTPIPDGTGNFTNFQGAGIDAGAVAFHGRGVADGGIDQVGIYSTRNGPLEMVAEVGTRTPNFQGTFIYFGVDPDLDAGTVAYKGLTQIAMGIYLNDADGLRLVADTDTAIPGGTGEFTSFSDRTSVEGDRVLFRGLGDDFQDAIFLADGSEIYRIIGHGDVLDGKTVDFVNMMTDSLSGDLVALTVTFAGFQPEAVYLVTVPEPGTGGLVIAGVLAIATARRRSRVALR